MTTPKLPLPTPSAVSKPFWDACARREFIVQTCEACDRRVFLPQEYCRHCQSPKLQWRPARGIGAVYSYTTVWRPPTPAFKTPYIVAIIDLDDGFQMITNLIECPTADAKVGMVVELVFKEVGAFVLPQFRPRRLA